MRCPNCTETMPDEARFCGNCGHGLAADCPNCGTEMPPDATFCGNCGAELGDGDAPGPSTADEGALQLRDHEFARRLDGEVLDADGLLSRLRQQKRVTVEEGNRALLLENGQITETLGPGRHTLDSLGRKIAELRRGTDLSVVLVTEGTTTVTVEVEDVRTATDYLVTVGVDLVISVADAETLFTELLNTRSAVTGETLNVMLGDAVRDELQATLAEYERDELYGNRELKSRLQSDVERELRRALERGGIDLVELLSFEYADDLDEVRRRQTEVRVESERQDVADRALENEQRETERETERAVHEERERVRRESARQSADHELGTQEIEQTHEKDDMHRRHGHKAERENVEHEEETETIRTEREVERRDIEHEQDVSEMEDLVDVKKKKDMSGLDVEERERELDMREDEHEVEMEKERLQARDDVDLDTLASMESVDEAVAELAEIEKAEDLTPEQLEALGAKESDELAKARQEAHNAEKERERVEDQKEFRDELRDVADDSMDRMQETTESAMDNMGDAAESAAEDTSDNVIVSEGGGSGDDGDTTIVQGGPGGQGGQNPQGGQGGQNPQGGQDGQNEQPARDPRNGAGGTGDDPSSGNGDGAVACPDCGARVPADRSFCTDCGADL